MNLFLTGPQEAPFMCACEIPSGNLLQLKTLAPDLNKVLNIERNGYKVDPLQV